MLKKMKMQQSMKGRGIGNWERNERRETRNPAFVGAGKKRETRNKKLNALKVRITTTRTAGKW